MRPPRSNAFDEDNNDDSEALYASLRRPRPADNPVAPPATPPATASPPSAPADISWSPMTDKDLPALNLPKIPTRKHSMTARVTTTIYERLKDDSRSWGQIVATTCRAHAQSVGEAAVARLTNRPPPAGDSWHQINLRFNADEWAIVQHIITAVKAAGGRHGTKTAVIIAALDTATKKAS